MDWFWKTADWLADFVQHDHLTGPVLSFSVIMVCMAILLSLLPNSHGIAIVFFVIIAAIARDYWEDAQANDQAERVAELNACIEAYNSDRDGARFSACLDRYSSDQANPVKNTNRLNEGFFLNLSTEALAQCISIALLLSLKYIGWIEVKIAARTLAALALVFSVVLIEDVGSPQEFYLNLFTEFVGIAVTLLVVENVLDDDPYR